MSLATKGDKLGLKEEELGIWLESEKGDCKGKEESSKELNGIVSINGTDGLRHDFTDGHVSEEMGQGSNVTSGLEVQARPVDRDSTPPC
ncbi:hypothetical protein V6N13_020150 [Hibiscus sabdariffa]|uniref:Uncharacterized protein n=1 Tax=Hibiscus sabdariffa TaxID=183260 RepID=A0ABR2ET42_9ROSI